jgi:hypothetical protein
MTILRSREVEIYHGLILTLGELQFSDFVPSSGVSLRYSPKTIKRGSRWTKSAARSSQLSPKHKLGHLIYLDSERGLKATLKYTKFF